MKKLIVIISLLCVSASSVYSATLSSFTYCPTRSGQSVSCVSPTRSGTCTYYAGNWYFNFGGGTYDNTCIEAPPAPTCTDGVKNGTETGVDCGGTCTPCIPAHCTNTVKDGNETGLNCGGSCVPCVDGACPAAPPELDAYVQRLCATYNGKSVCSCDYVTDPYPDNKCPEGFDYHSNRPFYDPWSKQIVPGGDPYCYKKTEPPQVAGGSPAPAPHPPLTHPTPAPPPPTSPPPAPPAETPTGAKEKTTVTETTVTNNDNSTTNTKIQTTIITQPNGDMSRQVETTVTNRDPQGKVTGGETTRTGVPRKGASEGEATSDDLKDGLVGVKGSTDAVKDAVTAGTGTLGGKLDAIKTAIDNIDLNLAVSVDNSGIEQGLDEIKGDGSFVGPTAPAPVEFNTSALDASLGSRVQTGVSKLKAVYEQSPVGSYVSNGFGTLSGPSSSSMSVNMGSYGEKTVDFGPWASSLGLLRLFLLAAAGVVCLRIVIMKQH